MRRLAVLGAMAMEMAFSVGGATVFGYLLDRHFETSPVLTIVFMFVGLAGAVLSFAKMWAFIRKRRERG